MNESGLYSMSAVARELGVRMLTISDLAKTLKLEPLPMSNGKAKGLTTAHVRAIRKALGMTAEAVSA